jgi:CDP-glucose 4,6-dehydratase
MTLAEKIEAPHVMGSAFNFSAGIPATVLVKAIQRVIMRRDLAPAIFDQAKNEIKDQYLSSERAKELLGWQPAFDLGQGLEETASWYRANRAYPTSQPSNSSVVASM